ncbi:MAG: patatin-like phospholipase family protein [Draconibacterium sp.]|nr:patatin-like phospholipase family protein [Draconibacterium sp.]
MTKIISEQNWDKVINDLIDRKYIAYEEKLFGDKYIFSIPIQDKVFSLSNSLNSSFNIDLLMNDFFFPAAHITDFNDLPIPFVCIGTDLYTGDAVVLNSGSLARAVRASMSIPGFFPPVKYKDTYLVDGGVVNNYPAEQVKAMGADIIIGGDVQAGLIKDIDDFSSMAAILDQVISFNRVDANKKGMKLTDYYVNIPMPYGMMDFPKYDSIIAIGEKVARQHYAGLKALADSINAIEPYVNNRVATPTVRNVTIDSILWPSLNSKYRDKLIQNFDEISHSKTTFDQINEKMFILNGTKSFNELRFEFKTNNKDSLNLIINTENPNKGSLAAGVHYDNFYNASLLLNLTLRNIKGGRAKFFADFVLSQNPRLKTMFFINNGLKPGFGMETDFYSLSFSEYENGNKVNSWNFDNFNVSAFMPITFKNNYLFKAGFQFESFRFKQEIVLDPDLEAYEKFANYGNIFASFNFDSRDKVAFTKKGQLVELKFKHVFPFSDQWSDLMSNASILYLKYNWFISLTDKIVFESGVFGGYTFSEEKIASVQHLFGFGGLNPVNYVEGFVPFTGLQFVERFGTQTGKASAKFQYNFYSKLYATVMADIGFLEYDIQQIEDIEMLFGYGVKLGYDSFIGPIEFSVMSSNIDTSVTGFLNIGFWF